MSHEGGLAPGSSGDGEPSGPVGGPKTPQQIAAQRRLQQTQAQVDEVVGIMRVNVEKVLERDTKLSELDDRAGKISFMRELKKLSLQNNIAESLGVSCSQSQLVVDIMRTNVEKVLERDSKLSELDDRADALQQGASQFEQQAGKLKRKFWLKNLKMMIIMGIIGLILIIIIGVSLFGGGGSSSNDGHHDSAPATPSAASLVQPQNDGATNSEG